LASTIGPNEREAFMADDWKTIASFTPEQTAAFLGGGELGAPTIRDPAIAARYRRHVKSMRSALTECVAILGDALHEDSPATQARLGELWAGAQRGDPASVRLLATMMGELVKQALM
jgi:hypothetical protein